jgi:2-polyprenyl-6-methoxyphenol hydroxylase-like FAD-dependent oxidoreductase
MQSSTNLEQTLTVKQVLQTTCCVVGSGPAGAMLALLLARQGVEVILLEAHTDFDREFRGDTIHPSVLRNLEEIGLVDQLLKIPHTEVKRLSFETPNGPFTMADLSHLKGRYTSIAMIPQAQFLEFITQEASRYPNFRLIMGAQVDELIKEGDKVAGVRYRGHDGWYEVRSVLTVGTDGRFSRLRKLAGFEPIKTSPPMDILWFKLSHQPGDPPMTFGRVVNQQIVAVIDRGEYWQLGYIIPKGQYQKVRASGLEHFRQSVGLCVPVLVDRMQEIQEWKQVSVLSVESSYLPRWYQPGLLLIGDAAHVMSPIGGVGINYAIQDAVVASNILGSKLKYGVVQLHDLAAVQRQRQISIRTIQMLQRMIQQFMLARTLKDGASYTTPTILRIGLRIPGLRSIPARIIGYGIQPVHVKA